MRLIDANELTEMVWRERVDSRERIAELIARQPTIKAPTADAQSVKRGKLEERIGYGGWGDTYYHCSVCGSDWVFEEGTPKANEWNFCPHCGADVRSPETTKG